jgi:hypothetical protein
MNSIQPLELQHQSMTNRFLRRYPPEVSELTFSNLFVWRKSRPTYVAQVEDSLVFMVDASGKGTGQKVVFANPIGDASPIDVAQALDGEVAGFVRIPRGTADALARAGLRVEPDRNNADYVYRVEEMAELAGRRFHKKRNLVKQCLETYECTYEPITPERIPECFDMHERWCKARQCGLDRELCSEYVAVREGLTHWERLGLLGGAIRIDGQIQAFAVGEALRPDMAVCHFEKALHQFQGLGQLVNQWFSKYALKGFMFVNREQDLGISGLRQAKKSYHPHHMVEKFRAWLPGASFDSLSPVEPHECAKHRQKGPE